MHSSANIMVGNLALADIVMSSLDAGFVAVSSFHGGWIFGNFGCKAYAYTVSVMSILSISTLTLIAIDRYVVIVKCWVNYRRSRKKTTIWFLSIAWFYSILWATCPLLGWGSFMLEGFGTSCTFDYLTRSLNNTSYVICLNIFVFFIPVSIISVCYVNIIRSMYKHKKEMKNVLQMLGTNPRVTRGKKLNVELKTARALAIAIVLFCSGWAPYAIMSLIAQFGDSRLISRLATGIPGIAAKCVTCMNPFLYAISNPIFLRKIKEIICCRPCDSKECLRTQPQEREDSTTTKHEEEQFAVYLPNCQTCLLLPRAHGLHIPSPRPAPSRGQYSFSTKGMHFDQIGRYLYLARRKRSQKRRPMSFYTSRSWILAGPNNSEQNWVEHFECTSLGTNSRCETGKENSSCQPFIKSELGIPLAEDIKIKSEITLESAGSVNNYYQILMKRSGTI